MKTTPPEQETRQPDVRSMPSQQISPRGDPSRQVVAAFEELAGRIAHDINNPLAGIQNSVFLLRRAIATDHPHYGFLAMIEREIERLASLSQRLCNRFTGLDGPDGWPTLRTASAHAVAVYGRHGGSIPISIELGAAARCTVAMSELILGSLIHNLIQDLAERADPGASLRIRALLDEHGVVLSLAMLPGAGSTAESGGNARARLGGAVFGRMARLLGIAIELTDHGESEIRVRLPLAVEQSNSLAPPTAERSSWSQDSTGEPAADPALNVVGGSVEDAPDDRSENSKPLRPRSGSDNLSWRTGGSLHPRLG